MCNIIIIKKNLNGFNSKKGALILKEYEFLLLKKLRYGKVRNNFYEIKL
jgi:hypothetical protein